MASQESGYFPIELRRGETRPIPLTYGPTDKTLPRYNLTGKPVEMRIKPDNASEIVFESPEIQVTNGVGGEITLAIPGAAVTGFSFQNAPYVILLDGLRLLHGTVTVKGLYE